MKAIKNEIKNEINIVLFQLLLYLICLLSNYVKSNLF